MYMRGQKGPIRVIRRPYLTLMEPNEDHRGHKAMYGSEGGHLGPVCGLYRAKWGNRDLIMSLVFHRAPRLDPTE